jgi:hypothetical protein
MKSNTDVQSTQPKILFLDIETFPNIAYVWGKYDQNVIDYLQQTCIATYAAKWLDKPVFAASLPEYKGYTPKSYNDLELVKDLWKLFDEADIIVAHNGKSFDIKVVQGRFVFYGMKPPRPFKVIDTKLVAKAVGRFNSNALNDLGQLLGLGKKIKTDFDLWKGCIEGEPKAWAKMVAYNKQDVLLLESTYKRFRPYITDHPNLGLWYENIVCPKCGSHNLEKRGIARTTTRMYQRYACNDCGGWSRSSKSEYTSKQVNNLG